MALRHFNPFTAHTMMSGPVAEAVGRPAPTVFELAITGEIGEFYRIESSIDMKSWTAVEVILLVQTKEVRDYTIGSGSPRRFFRAVHLPDNQ